MAGFRNYFFVFFLLVILALVVFGNSLGNQLFYDDEELIYKNYYVQNITLWPNFFTQNMIAGAGKVSNMYRPLLMISFGVNHLIGGLNPFIYHLTNILLHATNSFLIFLLISKLFNSKKVSFLTAILFLIHPVQTEAVTYVSGRTDPLFAFFMLLSLLFFIKFLETKNKIKLYLFTVFFFLCSLLAKETAIVFPFLGFLILLIKEKSFLKVIWKKSLILLPFLMISVIYFLLRLTVLNFNNTLNFYVLDTPYSSSLLVRFYTFCSILWDYFVLLFWPTDLSNYYEIVPVTNLFSLPVIAFITLILFIFTLVYCLKYKIGLFSLLWFFICLLPVSGIVPINNIMAEHYLYLPSLGFFLILSALFWFLYEKVKIKEIKLLLTVLLFFLLCALGFRTYLRNQDWSDPIKFYTLTLKKNLNHAPMRNNLAMAYAEKGQLDLAKQEYLRAIEINDYYPQTHHNLGNIYLKQGKLNLAEQEYLKALKIDPNFIFSIQALKKLYHQQGRNLEEVNKKIQELFK